ncbi:hypothetical protein N8348_04015 [Litorivicinus sp.]|nr:hypothetical protein [Litorivicinus sp.]MDC1240525.1 hypothetical protein [Litorivicinus sp.]MDC1466844.1 hypothetical protein [Litorivicinus sp.]
MSDLSFVFIGGGLKARSFFSGLPSGVTVSAFVDPTLIVGEGAHAMGPPLHGFLEDAPKSSQLVEKLSDCLG